MKVKGNGRIRGVLILKFTPLLLALWLLVAGQAAAAPEAVCDTQSQIPQAECEALVDLYDSTNGATWTDSSNWLNSAPCDWFGVTCLDGQVDSLQLTANNLVGTLPASLGNLSALTFLHLGGNALSGEIPVELGKLSKLVYLYLNNNALTGAIPAELGDISSLEFLYLNGAKLTDTVPASLCAAGSLLTTNLAYNLLSSRGTDSCVNSLSPDWDMTQTVPPSGVAAGRPAGVDVHISWTPIEYSTDGGYYEIYRSGTSGGPYELVGRTPDKTGSNYVLRNLDPNTAHYFVIRTVTLIHDRNKNELVSEDSLEVTTTPVALTLTSFAVDQRPSSGWAGLVAVLLLTGLTGGMLTRRARARLE